MNPHDDNYDRKNVTPGLMSLVLIVASYVMAYVAFFGATEAISIVMCTSGTTTGSDMMQISGLLGFGSIITWMLSLVLAGAGRASKRGSSPAMLTLLIAFLPFLIFAMAYISGITPVEILQTISPIGASPSTQSSVPTTGC